MSSISTDRRKKGREYPDPHKACVSPQERQEGQKENTAFI